MEGPSSGTSPASLGARPWAPRLRRRGFTEDSVIRATTAAAPRIIHLVVEKAEQEPVRELARSLLGLRKDAYMLHTAFYEGPEHAGFTGPEEAPSKQRQGSPKGSGR